MTQTTTTRQSPVPAGATINGAQVDADGKPVTAGPTGSGGMALGAAGEIAGGEITDELRPVDAATEPNHALEVQRKAAKFEFFRTVMAVSGRPITEMGLLGKGDTVRGHMILVNAKNGEKVRAQDGAKIEGDDVFFNARNMPESLSQGDVKANLG